MNALKHDPGLQQIEKVRCARDNRYWLWGDGIRHDGYVYTIDPHDKNRPIKHFPRKPYLEFLVETWNTEPLLLVPKSRQIMATWLFCALYLHDAQFNVGRYIYFQSKKEEDSDYLVQDRAGFILEYEPPFLWPREFDHKKHVGYCSIAFESQKSYIQGIPEGGDQIRSKVPSGVLSDESAFQPEFEAAIGAMQPCIKGGARLTGLSSANPGFFKELVLEKG